MEYPKTLNLSHIKNNAKRIELEHLKKMEQERENKRLY